jgi:phosphoribosyl-ATP pyrophosphohydrolase/phosphoribosyl-AMP cyclohydrolase
MPAEKSPADLAWNEAGLVTVVVQSRFGGEIRMVAHANREAVDETLSTGIAHFFSRSRKSLWKKGETSGNTIAVAEVWVDCDRDALVYLADPHGPSCHTGEQTCFFERLDAGGEGHAGPTLFRLGRTLEARRDEGEASQSYTKKLLDAGPPKIAEKVREEADELAGALTDESDERVVSEAADVLYHVMVGLLARGLTLEDVARELARRFGTSGIEEKASRG